MKFNKILSAGCSFIQGNELGDEHPFSQFTYPALLAKHFHVPYDSVAYASASNQGIANRLFQYNDYNNTLVIVQWTYPSRFGVNLSYSYTDKKGQKQTWFDLAPNNWDLQNVFDDDQSYAFKLKELGIDKLSNTVFKHFGNDENFLFQTKLCIESTKNFLMNKKVPFVFFCTTPLADTNTFDNLGFIEWCDKHSFPKGKYNHPLHDAHQFACEYILDNNLVTKSQQL